MEDFEELEIETTPTTPSTPQDSSLSKKQLQQVAESAERNRQSEMRSLSDTLGTVARQQENKTLTEQAIQYDTLDNVIRTTKNIDVDDTGKLYFPDIPTPDGLSEEEFESSRNLQKQAQASLQYVLDKYNEDRQSVGGDVAYIAGSAIRSATDLVAETLALAPQVAGMGIQYIGTKTGDGDNWAVRNGTLLQEWTAHRLDLLHQGMTDALMLNPAQTSEAAREISKITDTGLQVGAIAAGALAGGAAGAAKATAIAGARGASKALAKRYANLWANQIAKRVGKGASVGYAAAQTEDYLLRPYQGKTSEEYLQYLRGKTGGDILSDLGWATVVGLSNYYLENAFGANASIKNYFGDAGSGLMKMVSRRALEEGATEVAQDKVLDVADLLRGRMPVGEFMSKLVDKDTLETFVISAIIGGATATGEYASTRMNLVKNYKQAIKKVFPEASEQQLETAGKAFINTVEDDVISKVRTSIIADDQLRNQYGTYNAIVRNRINELIDQTVAEGKELAFKDKSPEYQAQYVGSVAQRFVDELYSQAVMREMPINEVFNVNQMQVENGILYMYGTEYGRRPLSQFTKEMTPAQWYKAQQEARIADELQKKQKEQQKAIRDAERQARQAEKEQAKEAKRQASDEQAVPHRNYLLSVGVESTDNLTNREAIRDARIMARAEIRDMDTDVARGILATIRPDLPTLTMKTAEIKQILRGEIDRYIALDGRENIQALAPAPSMLDRQKAIVERPRKQRMAKPKSFSQRVKASGISKDTVERLGLVGEFKKILGDNYRFYVRKNGTINNMEEFVAEYATEDNSYQGTVNGFIDLFERDLQTKDIYSPDDETALKNWQENSIRAEREQQGATQDEILQAQTYLAQNKIDTTGMSNEQILSEAQKIWNQNNPELMDSDITVEDLEEIPDEFFGQNIKEITDLADENARLDDIYPEYTGETIEVDGKERTVYNSNGDRIAKSAEALTNFWRWFSDSKVVDEQGRPLVVYHQTSEKFDTFMRGKDKAGKFDYETPSGFFFKSSDKNIGIAGNIQMPVYLKAEKSITFDNREQLQQYWVKNIDGYAELLDKYKNVDKEYNAKTDKIDEQLDKAIDDLEKSEAYKNATDAQQYQMRSDLVDNFDTTEFFAEWRNATDKIAEQMKQLVNDYVSANNIEMVKLENDSGAIGKKTTDSFIVFEPNQIKSVDNRGTYSSDTGNIFYQRIGSVFDLKIGDEVKGLGRIQNIEGNTITINGTQYSKMAIDNMANRGEIETITPDVNVDFDRAKSYFGTTTNMNIAGYILPDGTMLDFSGKKFGADGRNRTIDHREVADAYEGEIDMDEFLRGGAIRIDATTGAINAATMPTLEQMRLIERIVNQNRDGVSLELEGMARTLNEYYENTTADKIKNIIRGYFNNANSRITEFRQKTIGAWNPLRKTIELGTGANETTIAHELSHFWLDNMMMYSRLASAAQNEGFARVWNNIKRYLDIDDRQDVVNVAQAEKYTSAYMQYIRNNKTAPVSDLGFKGLDEYIGDISLDYFENALHKEQDGSYTSELEQLTPEIVDALQALTTTDLQKYKDIIIDMQMSEATSEDITDAKLGAEATPEQMRSSGISEMRAQQNKQIEQGIKAAEADAQPIETPKTTAEMKTAEETNAKIPSSRYEIGTTDTESFAKAREIIAKDRNLAEQIIAENPDGITDGIANEFIALELAQQAVQQGQNAMPYLESFVNGASAAGANLRVASLLNTPEFAWAKDMYEASKARDYALALRMRPGVKNALMRKSAIVRAMESKLDEYVETLYPQLLQAQSYEEQVKLINDWGNNVAKEIGVQPSTELWYQTIGGNVGTKKTDFSKAVDYQKRKLKEFLKSKIGATLSDTEQLKVRELHRNAIDSLRVLNADPTNREKKIEFIKQTRAYQDYLNALQPANWATSLFASIPRASMLFRISTQVKNTLGTRVEILLSDINRSLRYGTGNLISDKDITAEIKDSMDMFSIGGFSPDVQESFFESPTLAWGEKQFSLIARGGEKRGAVLSKERLAQDAKDIAEYARNNWKSDDPTYKKVWGATRIALGTLERATGKSFDILAYSDAFMKADIAVKESAKMATFIAKTEGKEKGWTNEQIKARAYELFADARSFIPKTTVGQSIRKRAVEQAKLETFIKSGTLSQVANNIRNSLNLGKESGIGTFIAPFVSTPANVMQLGVDYATGWWRRFGTQTIKTKDGKTVELGWKECKQRIIDNVKAGKPINEYDMQYLEKGYRGSYGGLFLLTMMALFAGAKALGDGDEIDYVPPYQSLSARERQYYKAINGGKYNCLKIGDVWVNAEYFGGLSEAITALGTWYHNNSVISSLTTEIMRAPVIGDLIQTKQDFDKDIQYNKSLLDSAFEGAESQLKKYIPGIIQDIDRAREKGALYVAFGGSFGITTDSEIKEVKDAQTESGASYTPITRGKGFKELDQTTKRKINREFDELYNADVAKWLKSHKNAKPEVKKKALNKIRKDITTKLKRKYKIK